MATDAVHDQLADLGGRRARGRPARVVVVGNVGNGNTGDEALLAVTLDVLRAANPGGVEVSVLSRDPARVRQMHGVTAATMTVRGALPALARCDALVVVGGGMFGPGLPRLVGLLPWLVVLAALAGRDTAYAGIGAYPGMPAVTLAGLRCSVRLGRGATVRDTASGRLLDPGHPPPCVGDLALQLAAAPEADATSRLEQAGVDLGRPLLVLAPKAGTTPGRTDQLVRASVLAVQHWTDQGGSVAALALGDRTDHGIEPGLTDSALARLIGDSAGTEVPVLGPGLHPSLALSVVGRAHAVLGLRFHGVVFAARAGVPATSFSWEAKTAAALAEAGEPALREPVDPEQVRTWLDGCLARVRSPRLS